MKAGVTVDVDAEAGLEGRRRRERASREGGRDAETAEEGGDGGARREREWESDEILSRRARRRTACDIEGLRRRVGCVFSDAMANADSRTRLEAQARGANELE